LKHGTDSASLHSNRDLNAKTGDRNENRREAAWF
jgi:hypothetical protein